MKISQAVITIGGKGTRLESITNGVPKPLYPINEVSTLERAINVLNLQGISKFVFLINFLPDLFKEFSNKIIEKYNVDIQIIFEDKPRGEAGSIFDCLDILDNEFLFVHGDIIFDIDLQRFNNFHFLKNSDLTIITHITNHPEDSDCIIESPNLSIAKYKLKNSFQQNNSFFLGNAGLAIVSKKVINYLKNLFKFEDYEISFFKDIVLNALKIELRVFSYNTSEYLKDIGTPTRFKNASEDIKNNYVSRKSYRSKQKVLFLDRDGTLIKCKEKKYILDKNEVIFYEDRIRKIASIAKDFDFCLIVTNQPQISMGLISWQDVIEINGLIINQCQAWDLKIAGFYLCPHHPHSGFKDEINSLKVNCFCRKPYPGLFYEAAYMRNIDLKKSLLIGDTENDLNAAKNSKMDFLSVDEIECYFA